MSDKFAAWLASRVDDTPAPMLSDGTAVGDFVVVGFLGRGGHGEVYRAEHRELKFPVAVKVLHRGDETGRARFAREAELLAKHPNPGFPRFYAYGEINGHPYLVTELLEERPLPGEDRRVAAFICKVAAAVGELHKLGYVHRDIKPSNILWRADGRDYTPVLIDFGLVKRVEEECAPSLDTISIEGGKPVGVGTPGYAAPEQFAGGAVGFATDIHALGVLVNACFDGDLPKEWQVVVQSATSSIKAQRPADIQAFINAVGNRHHSHHRRLRFIVVLTIAGGIASAAVMLNFRTHKDIQRSTQQTTSAERNFTLDTFNSDHRNVLALADKSSTRQKIEAMLDDARYQHERQKRLLARSPSIELARQQAPISIPDFGASAVLYFEMTDSIRSEYGQVVTNLFNEIMSDYNAGKCGMPVYFNYVPNRKP